MTLAQNHQPRSSGNKLYLILILGLYLAACSPKIQPKGKPDVSEAKEKKEPTLVSKMKEVNISLLVPFNVNDFDLKSARKEDQEKASMAINFYQGVKLGLDSAAASGMNFKLNVYDTQDDQRKLSAILENQTVVGSNLVIGPVFPDGLKYIRPFAVKYNLPFVSPLAASKPEDFHNPNLISIVNNIDLHAAKIGNYIFSKYLPENTVIVLINPKKTDDELLGAPLRDYFSRGKGSKFTFEEYASVYALETKLIRGKKYVVLVSTSDRAFVAATLDKMIKMKKAGLLVDLFGHPNWAKQNYSTDKLQALNTIITSSYKVNYKSSAVLGFVRKYRKAFGFEPDEYSFKGFDTGFYFGKLLSKYGADYRKYLTKEPYKGLHNSFSFVYDENNGYINTSLMLLKYRDYALYLVQ
jgi:ABC-type branched-subunit amino acid transport system substrate-binding protein